MRWWEKKVKGWTVPFWYTDTPLYSKRVRDVGFDKIAKLVRMERDQDSQNGNTSINGKELKKIGFTKMSKDHYLLDLPNGNTISLIELSVGWALALMQGLDEGIEGFFSSEDRVIVFVKRVKDLAKLEETIKEYSQ